MLAPHGELDLAGVDELLAQVDRLPGGKLTAAAAL